MKNSIKKGLFVTALLCVGISFEIFNKREIALAFGGATVGAILVSVKDEESDG